jgi:predicted double-glycine peptidase
MSRLLTILIIAGLMVAGLQATASARTKSLKEIREAGVVIQQWDTSCAAAALATVFTYVLRRPISERTVAQSMLKRTDPLKVKHRGGFSLLDMKRFVETQGYQAMAMKGFEMDDLVYFDGVIVPINQFGYNHYVIFRGINGDGKVHLADPAFGNRTLSKKSFEGMWMDGIVFFVTGGQ